MAESNNSPKNPANEIKSPLYIRQVTEERGWPAHVEKLVKENVDIPVSIHHISAAIVFVMCVESGFIPEDKNNVLPDAATIFKTLDCDKISRLSSRYPDSSCMAECRSFIFRAILDSFRQPNILKTPKTVTEVRVRVTFSPSGANNELPSTSHAVPDATNNHIRENHSVTIDVKECRPDELSEIHNSRYIYSSPIKLVMVFQDDCIQISGMHEKRDLRNYRLSYQFKVQEYLKKPTRTVNEGRAIKKLASEWLSELALDAPRMVQDFKNNFALPLMDSIGGLSNELRGIQSLPPEVLIQILKMCPGKTVAHVSQTSCYLNAVTEDQSLWRHLVWRDYKNSRHANDAAVVAAGKKPPDVDYNHDYQQVYKQLWVSSHEGMNQNRRANWDDFEYEDYDDYYFDNFSDDDDDMALLRFI